MINEDFEKVLKIIQSCKTLEQVRHCKMLVNNFATKYINDHDYLTHLVYARKVKELYLQTDNQKKVK